LKYNIPYPNLVESFLLKDTAPQLSTLTLLIILPSPSYLKDSTPHDKLSHPAEILDSPSLIISYLLPAEEGFELEAAVAEVVVVFGFSVVVVVAGFEPVPV